LAVSDFYAKYWSDHGFAPEGLPVPQIDALFQQHVTSQSRCLDVGCGDGKRAGTYLCSHAHSYLGVDISAGAVEKARANGFEARQIEDAERLPFEDDSFDLICASEVLEHLFRPDMAGREISRVLVPGGVLVVTVPNVAYWRWRADMAFRGVWNPLGDWGSVEHPWRDAHIRFFTLTALRAMLEECGFEGIEVGGYGGSLDHLGALGRRLKRWGRPFYERFERQHPGLLSWNLYAVARAPAGR